MGPFHIYGSRGQPWFTARTWYWAEKGTIDLWGYFLTARSLAMVIEAQRLIYYVVFIWIFHSYVVYLGQVKSPTLNFWYTVCLDIDTVKETMDTAINGIVTSQDVELGEGVAEQMPRQLQGKLVLGKWNYTFTGVEDQFVWSITNLEIFRGSDSLDLAAVTKDLCSSYGDFLALRDMEWKVEGNVEQTQEESDKVCGQPTTYRILLPEAIGQEDGVATCDKLGHGNMVAAASKEEIGTLVDWAEETQGASTSKCPFIWTPFSDQAVEDTFVNIENGKELESIAWMSGQPNGGSTENSLKINVEAKLIEDEKEANGNCVVCTLQRSFSAALRGGCEETKLERLFYMENIEAGGVRYLGYAGSVISFEPKEEVWKVRHHSSPSSVLATINASSDTFLLGPFQWTFEGDSNRWEHNPFQIPLMNIDLQVLFLILIVDVPHRVQQDRICLQGRQLHPNG